MNTIFDRKQFGDAGGYSGAKGFQPACCQQERLLQIYIYTSICVKTKWKKDEWHFFFKNCTLCVAIFDTILLQVTTTYTHNFLGYRRCDNYEIAIVLSEEPWRTHNMDLIKLCIWPKLYKAIYNMNIFNKIYFKFVYILSTGFHEHIIKNIVTKPNYWP